MCKYPTNDNLTVEVEPVYKLRGSILEKVGRQLILQEILLNLSQDLGEQLGERPVNS